MSGECVGIDDGKNELVHRAFKGVVKLCRGFVLEVEGCGF
jgi:hypothetical protein